MIIGALIAIVCFVIGGVKRLDTWAKNHKRRRLRRQRNEDNDFETTVRTYRPKFRQAVEDHTQAKRQAKIKKPRRKKQEV